MNRYALRRLLSGTLCSALILTGPGSYAAAQFVARSAYAPAVSGAASAAAQIRFIVAPPASALSLTPSAPRPTPNPVAAAAVPVPGRATAAAPVSAVERRTRAALAEAGPISTASPSSAEGLGRRLEDFLTGGVSLHAIEDAPAPAAGAVSAAHRAGDLARAGAAVKKPLTPEPANPGPPTNSLIPKLIASAAALIPIYFFGLPMLTTAFTLKAFVYLALALPLVAMPFKGRKAPVGLALFANGLLMLFTGDAIIVGLLAALTGSGFQMWREKNTESGLDGRFGPEEVKSFIGALGTSAAVGAVWAGFVAGWPAWVTIALAAATSPLLLRHLRK